MSRAMQAMHGQRRLDSRLKRERVTGAVDALLAAGADVTVARVARHAAVSRKFIYSHPDLRAELELRALRATQTATVATVNNARVTGASLRADTANCKAHNQRLRQQITALERRLSETLGTELAATLGSDAPFEHDSVDELRRRLEDSERHTFEVDEALAAAREELDAVREINRELLAERNRTSR